MKRSLFSLLYFVLAGILTAQSITGIVKDADSNDLIANALVKILDSSNNALDSAYSNSSGYFEINYSPTNVLDASMPVDFSVRQNYPNPFNPSTIISFNIYSPGDVVISVSNILGELIDARTKYLEAGGYSVRWNSTGSAGVYFYTITFGNKSVTRKMIQLDGGSGGGFSDFSKYYVNDSNLNKTSLTDVQIVTSKFAYVSDTLYSDLTGNLNLDIIIRTIHSQALVIDLHNDVLERMLDNNSYHLGQSHNYYHTDLPRLKIGGVDAQLFVVWVSPGTYAGRYFETANSMINIFKTEVWDNYSEFQQVYDPASLFAVNDFGKIGGILVVEGGHSIENSIGNLIQLYDAGMRYLTITWNNSTDWAVSAQDARTSTVGLSDFGRQVIRTMDSLGVIIDVSHTGIKTIEDILEVTTNPIIASHSGVRALKDHYRNLYGYQIQAIANSGGVIGIVFYPPFLGSNSSQVDIETVIQHINYIVQLVGIDYVALGSDFDGIGDNTVNGLEDVTKFPDLTFRLLEQGYNRGEVEKILGLNFLRVFNKVCGNNP